MDDDQIAKDLERMSRADAVDPTKDYYVFRFTGTLDGRVQVGLQTHWVGYADGDPKREIREGSIMNPSWWINAWEKMEEEFLVVNQPIEAVLLMREGGNALVEKSVAEEMFPNRIAPQEYDKGGQSVAEFYPPKPSAAFNRAPTPKVRLAVLKRDRYRCRMCGKRPADDVHVELNVHHIIPWEEGGLSERKNLITLCRTCHRGLNPHFDPEIFGLIPDEEKVTESELRYEYRVAKILYQRAWAKM